MKTIRTRRIQPVHGAMALIAALFLAAGVHADESGGTNAAPKKLVLVKASPTPLGENSVIAVTAAEARRELDGIRGGLVRERLRDPLPKPLMEQGGLARVILKDPKPKKILGLFSPVAPEDSQSVFLRTHRVNTLRGTPPLPHSMQDPIWIEPVGLNLFNWDW
jgi:hypothetical protein